MPTIPVIIGASELVTSLIGREVITKGITDTASSIYNLIIGVLEYNHQEVKDLIDELDITATLEVLDSLVQQHAQVDAKLGSSSSKTTADISFQHLQKIVENIHQDLKLIDQAIQDYQQIWFRSLRSPNYQQHLKNLRQHKLILDKRLDLMIKMLAVGVKI